MQSVCDNATEANARGQKIPEQFDVIIVGAGLAGLYMLHKLRQLGLSALAFEAAPGVGGTWYWNRYPGARCDIESMFYSYSFSEELQQDWHWTERYASQPEILAYINHVADAYDLRRDIRPNTRVTAATWSEDAALWEVRTDVGDTVTSRFVVWATGIVTVPYVPPFAGLSSFAGECHHTARWPQDHAISFAGKRVAIIGTGSSAVQMLPIVAAEAEHVFVFQRTPAFCVPARNGPLEEDVQRRIKSKYGEYRENARESMFGIPVDGPTRSLEAMTADERASALEEGWAKGGFSYLLGFNDVFTSEASNAAACEFLWSKIRLAVADPVLAERLTPRTYPLGTKRMCVDSGYYESFNRSNVTLVDVTTEKIHSITAGGVRTETSSAGTGAETGSGAPSTPGADPAHTASGRAVVHQYDVDVIVLATGFDAFTGAILSADVRGRGGQSLRSHWANGPRTYLGMATHGFPNMFVVTGPGSPAALTNVVAAIEQSVDWICGCVTHARGLGATAEATEESEDAWMRRVAAVADHTLLPRGESWYVGANIPGKPRGVMVYVGGFVGYRATCNEVASNGYEGFGFAGVPASPLARTASPAASPSLTTTATAARPATHLPTCGSTWMVPLPACLE